MKVYLDICCLKRPFDSQEQALARLEAEAVMAILSWQQSDIVLTRTPAQVLENALNPVRWRREAVGADVLLTVDERFLRKAQAHAADLRIRVISPITLVQEVV